MNPDSTRKIAIVGDYLPRKCGIATFSHSVYRALFDDAGGDECFIVAVNDVHEGYAYPPEVRFEIAEQDISSYRRAADFLNLTDTDVICLQHEFGIYGGPAGSHILSLLRHVHIPVVTQLHTILEEPTAEQMYVMKELATLSTRIIVMSERGRQILNEIYGVRTDHLDVIPHGVPDMPFVDPNYYKDQFGVEGKQVLLTFGLISPAKGIENVIRALPAVIKVFPEMVYIVLGATHPHLLREQGETYRLSLERLALELGVRKQVIFYNRFVGSEELKDFLGVADIYITPYLNRDQITSGTLSYAFGCGKAVISTPYRHAEELLAEGRGVLVPFRNSDAIAEALIGLLTDDVHRHAMRKQAYLLGRGMIWRQVAELYANSFEQARLKRGNGVVKQSPIKSLEQEPRELPALRLEHLKRISDSTGIYQHAKYSFPNFKEGYCTDDNVRALQLLVILEESGDDTPDVKALATCCASFINYAYVPGKSRFHNFMSFERTWLDEDGSDDCLGRTLLALGTCVGRSRRDDLRHWALDLFQMALPSVSKTTSPRAWALGLKAIHEYLRKMSGDRTVDLMRDTLTDQLLVAFKQNCSNDWPWFEHVLSYDNACLPHALILSGRWSKRGEALDLGLHCLRWLMAEQTAEAGHFRPIGSNGFYRRGQQRAVFDQQPLEACASVSACVEAWSATADSFWLDEAWRAFAWFLGDNDLQLPLYDARSGGCFDGLQDCGVNMNQGAESTLAFLLALQEMKLLELARQPILKQ